VCSVVRESGSWQCECVKCVESWVWRRPPAPRARGRPASLCVRGGGIGEEVNFLSCAQYFTSSGRHLLAFCVHAWIQSVISGDEGGVGGAPPAENTVRRALVASKRRRSSPPPSAAMSPAATAFEKDVPYDYWLQHACGEQFEFLDQATTNLDGSPRPSYIERMRECPRCWAETNTEDALLSPGVGRPFPAGARGTNCLELGADEAVPDWLWRKFEGGLPAPYPTAAHIHRHPPHPPHSVSHQALPRALPQ
jgi:hypothetical protein